MKKIRSILLCLLVIVFLAPAAITALAAGETAVPAIGGDKYYLDLAEALSPEFEADVVSRNTANKGQSLAEIYIVTIKSLGGADLKTFSNSLFDKWEIGTKENHNGVLLLMSIDDKNYYAIAGEGASAKFGGTLDQLLKTDVEPDFAAGSYEAAAKKFLDAAEQRIKGTAANPAGTESSQTPATSSEAPASGGVGDAIWGFFRALLIIVGIVLALGIIFVVVANLRSRRRKSTRRSHHPVQRPRPGVRPDTRQSTYSRRTDVYPDEDEPVSSEDIDDDTFGD